MKRFLAVLFVALAAVQAHAADYPDKPVRIGTPFPPGGSSLEQQDKEVARRAQGEGDQGGVGRSCFETPGSCVAGPGLGLAFPGTNGSSAAALHRSS